MKKQIWYQIRNFFYIIYFGLPYGGWKELKVDARDLSATKKLRPVNNRLTRIQPISDTFLC